ncbi:MAG: hypothetical protein R3F35_23740 [Myxococcota bacterium]
MTAPASRRAEVERIERRIREREADLGRALMRLEDAAKESVRPSNWIQRDPTRWLAGAFVAGFVWGWCSGRPARSPRREKAGRRSERGVLRWKT